MEKLFAVLALLQLHIFYRDDDPYWECFYFHEKRVKEYRAQAEALLETL
jgi:hypothetical protein